MATSLSKILTRSNAHSHWCSTTTNISTSPSLRDNSGQHFSAVADSSFSSSAALGSQSSSSTPPQENKRGSKWSQLLLFLPGAITFGLGAWQIIRREEKYQQQQLNTEPMKLNTEHPPDTKSGCVRI